MVNELMEERGFPDAPPSNEAEKRLVLELAVGLVGTGEMIEVALLSCRGVRMPLSRVPTTDYGRGAPGRERHQRR